MLGNWNLPYDCHTAVLQILNDVVPPYDLIRKRSISLARKCLLSESSLVRYVANNSVCHLSWSYVLGRNVQHCCALYAVSPFNNIVL